MTTSIAADALCPCGHGQTYSECCYPLHNDHDFAKTAEQLMRSRYCAWTLGLIDYLFQTTWSKQQASLVRKDLEEWAERTRWLALTIVDTAAGQSGDDQGEVEFRARFCLPPEQQVHEHHERSRFVKENDRWFFVDPNLPVHSTTTVGRNDPCPCGSGKKYKKCCG